MSRGFTFDFYLSCDGEDVLDRYDGNDCELTSDDGGTDNEGVDDERQDIGVITHAIIDAMIAAEDKFAESGWTSQPVRRGLWLHFCPACSKRWGEMSVDERTAAVEALKRAG